MAFKLSELLNPVPGNSKPASPVQSHSASHNAHIPTTTIYEAASALTALATSGAPSFATNYTYAPSQHQCSDGHRQSSFGSVAAMPVEPTPAIEQQSFSPTLHQYHHGSKSPEEQRRHSVISGSYGCDASQVLPPLSNPQDRDTSFPSGQDDSQNREPSYTRSGPTAHQIREPSHEQPLDLHSVPASTQAGQSFRLSPPPPIKAEPSATPREGTPSQQALGGRNNSVTDTSLDPQTLKAVAELKNEHGLRGQSRKASTPTLETSESASVLMAVDTKKRPAPKSTGATKKGTAKKPPAKKRKVDSDGTPISSIRRSETPSLRTSKPAAPGAVKTKKAQSGTPLGSSPAPQEPASDREPDESVSVSGSDTEVYCICRRPDNHKWMIACDGGCEDWFHGACVQIRESDGDLIDKFVCPNCRDSGRGNTTWKPMCRREGCRRPARLAKGSPSKYCSDECGEMFFRELVERARRQTASQNGAHGGGHATEAEKRRQRRKANHTDHTGAANATDDGETSDVDLGPRGGVLRPPELKALLTGVKDIDEFRRLGDGVLSPPPTASSPDLDNTTTTTNGDAVDGDTTALPTTYTLTPSGTARVATIADDKDALRARRALLKDRERFVALTRDQAARYAEREGIKKEFCGFDARHAWSEEQFARWRESRVGRTALRLGTLEPSEGRGDDEMEVDGEEEQVDLVGVGGETDVDGGGKGEEVEAKEPSLCLRKRCERHKHWQKLALQDVRFEEADVADKMRMLDAEEREIRERAMLRWRADVAARKKGDGEVVRGEGWVEVVEG